MPVFHILHGVGLDIGHLVGDVAWGILVAGKFVFSDGRIRRQRLMRPSFPQPRFVQRRLRRLEDLAPIPQQSNLITVARLVDLHRDILVPLETRRLPHDTLERGYVRCEGGFHPRGALRRGVARFRRGVCRFFAGSIVLHGRIVVVVIVRVVFPVTEILVHVELGVLIQGGFVVRGCG